MPDFSQKDNYLTPKTSFIPIIIVRARKILIIQTFWYQCWVILLCVLWCYNFFNNLAQECNSFSGEAHTLFTSYYNVIFFEIRLESTLEIPISASKTSRP